MDYRKLSEPELSNILARNPPDVPHYQKALSALQLGIRRKEVRLGKWTLVFTGAGLIVEL